jgi:hypothetical protein
MASIPSQIHLPRCPHCSIALPHLRAVYAQYVESKSRDGTSKRYWQIYVCATCGGAVMGSSEEPHPEIITHFYPQLTIVDASIPIPAHTYLQQAIESLHAPIGAVLLVSSAVDAMLKAKNYKEGTLNTRINEAAQDHLITQEMAVWAHEIRLDANDQRHADEAQPLPDEAQAKKCLDFALALAEFLFVLPTKVQRGRNQSP